MAAATTAATLARLGPLRRLQNLSCPKSWTWCSAFKLRCSPKWCRVFFLGGSFWENSRPEWGSLIDVTVKTLRDHRGWTTGCQCDRYMMLRASIAKFKRLYWCVANHVWNDVMNLTCILLDMPTTLWRMWARGRQLCCLQKSNWKWNMNCSPPGDNEKLGLTFCFCQLGVQSFADILKGRYVIQWNIEIVSIKNQIIGTSGQGWPLSKVWISQTVITNLLKIIWNRSVNDMLCS